MRNSFPFSQYKTSWVILENSDLVLSCEKKKKKGKGKTTEMNNIVNSTWISFCIFICEITLWAIVNRLLMCQEFSLRYLAALPRPASTVLSNHTRIARPWMLCVHDSRDSRVTCSGSREGWAYPLQELQDVLINLKNRHSYCVQSFRLIFSKILANSFHAQKNYTRIISKIV